MENNNYHGLPPIKSADKPKRNNTWIYLGIIILLLTTNILLFTNKKDADQKVAATETKLEKQDLENVNLNVQYGAALKKLDEMMGQNSSLDKQLKDQDSEITHLKNRIEAILNNKNATAKELSEAKGLISKLNREVGIFEKEIADLKNENKTLSVANKKSVTRVQQLKEEKDIVEEQLELAKVFTASNIFIQPIALRKWGNKESETSKARKVDILRIVFDLNENKVVNSGKQTFYIRIINPDGKLLTNQALGSGRFEINGMEETQLFTISKSLAINAGQSVQNVMVDWEQTADYTKGAYSIELYHQGFLIGKAITQLK